MEMHIKVKKILKIKGMEKENIFIQMVAIIMETGIKIKCLAMEYYITLMEKFNMMESGKMICLKVKEPSMETNVIG
jgi:hypothetical protein